jgi:tetratricopeptide (TPR) repeat protein
MKKLLPLFVLLCTTFAFTQNSNQPASTSTQATGSKSNAIQDTTEFQRWEDGRTITDPVARAKALEAFLVQYPNTVAKLPALLELLKAYQQAGNNDMLQPTAKRILEVDPNNMTALSLDVLLSYLNGQRGDAAAAAAAGSEARKALETLASWKKPDEMPQAEYDDKRKQMANIFNMAAAFDAFQKKDYASAREYYAKIIDADPNILNYQRLGASDLEMNPLDAAGFWYLAKAITMAQGDKTTVQQLTGYAKDHYRRYHGTSEGWDEIVVAAAKQPVMPADFTVKTKPTECEQVVAQVANLPEAELVALGVSDWEMVLSHRDCSPEAKAVAEKLWQAILAKQKNNGVGKLTFDGVKVISSTADGLVAAITAKNQQGGKADLQVTLEKSFASPPAAGAQFDIVGVVTDYTPTPFGFTMKDAEARASKPDKAAKKSATLVKKKTAVKPRAKVKSALR